MFGSARDKTERGTTMPQQQSISHYIGSRSGTQSKSSQVAKSLLESLMHSCWTKLLEPSSIHAWPHLLTIMSSQIVQTPLGNSILITHVQSLPDFQQVPSQSSPSPTHRLMPPFPGIQFARPITCVQGDGLPLNLCCFCLADLLIHLASPVMSPQPML